MRRISVVGTSGAGKSTAARELARNLGVPFVELDSIFHQPGWAPLPPEEFRRRVADLAAGDRWVIDGNCAASWPGPAAPHRPAGGAARKRGPVRPRPVPTARR